MIWLLLLAVAALVVTNLWWLIVLYAAGRRLVQVEAERDSARVSAEQASHGAAKATAAVQQLYHALACAVPIRKGH